MLYKNLRVASNSVIGSLSCLGVLTLAASAVAQEPCFERLDNGVDMTGWQRSTTNHHGPGEGWTVEDGAFVGRQTAGNLGGILMTDKTYSDVEVVLEVKIDWGCDSGIFFRTTAGDRAYQVNVDHLTGAGIGTIYGEGFSPELRARDYTLTNEGNTAIVEPGHTPIFDLSTWPTIWHPTDFNEIRARVEGNPPHIQVWIANVKVMDFTDTELRANIEPTGPLAIQVHGGGDRWADGGAVRYRNIRARDLSVACEEPADGGLPSGDDAGVAGSGGAGGTGGTASSNGGSAGSEPNVGGNPGEAGSSSGGSGENGGAGGSVAPTAGSNNAGGSDGESKSDDGGCTYAATRVIANGSGWLLVFGFAIASFARRRPTRSRR